MILNWFSSSGLKILLSAVALLIGCADDPQAQVMFPLEQAPFDEVKELESQSVSVVRGIGDRLFVGTRNGLWIVSSDISRATKVEAIGGHVVRIQEAGEQVLIGTVEFSQTDVNTKLWLLNRDGIQPQEIGTVPGNVVTINTIKGGLLIGTQFGRGRGLWVLKSRTKQIEPISNVPFVNDASELDGSVLVDAGLALCLVSVKARMQVFTVRRVPKDNYVHLAGLIGQDYVVGITSRSQGFHTAVWLISKDGQHQKQIWETNSRVNDVEIVGEHIFVCADNGLTIIGKGGETMAVDEIEPPVNDLTAANDTLFVSTRQGLWLISKDGTQARKAENIPFSSKILVAGDWLFIGDNNRTLLMVSKDLKHVRPYPVIRDSGWWVERFGNYFFITTAVDGTFIVDSTVVIKSTLVPYGWSSKIISSLLGPNWLPSGNVQAIASYADKTNQDPYPASYSKRFSFSKANTRLISFNTFSTQDDFRYEISWGKNEVHYWTSDDWGNLFEVNAVYYGFPSHYFVFILPFVFTTAFVFLCFLFAPKIRFCHSAIMNPWLRKYFSLGSIPLLLSVFPFLRRHCLRRYSQTIRNDRGFLDWETRFVYPHPEFLPENFGKRLESERRLLLTGQSGIGKTSFFRSLVASYASHGKSARPPKVIPVYIPLSNYANGSLEELVYDQLFSYGRITDKDLAPMFLELGGLLIFLDGVNEIRDVINRQKLSQFVEKFWTSNFICLSSQQSYPELENIPKAELTGLDPERIRQFLRLRVNNTRIAETVIKGLTPEEYDLYWIPQDLEFAVEILNNGENNIPKSRTELYKIVFKSVFARWNKNGNLDAEAVLCERAYNMIAQHSLTFDSVNTPMYKEISEDLYNQKFLVKREGSYCFRHDLIRSYLASEFFYLRWTILINEGSGTVFDGNWLDMLKFSCEKILDPFEVKALILQVVAKSATKDLVRELFEWIKTHDENKCKPWETDFYAKYGELDFKRYPEMKTRSS